MVSLHILQLYFCAITSPMISYAMTNVTILPKTRGNIPAHTAHISTHLVELKSTHRVDFTSKSTYSVDLKMHKSTSTVDLGINIFEPSCHISIVFSCEWLPNPLSNHQNDGEIGGHIYRN